MFYYYWNIVFTSVNLKLKFNKLKLKNLDIKKVIIYSYVRNANLHSLDLIRTYIVIQYLTKQYPKFIVKSFYRNGIKIKYTKCVVCLRKNNLFIYLNFFFSKLILILKKKNLIINSNFVQFFGDYTFSLTNLSSLFYFLPLDFYNWTSSLHITLNTNTGSIFKTNTLLSSFGLFLKKNV